MRNLLISLLALLPVFSMTACHKHTRIVEEGQPGADGQDGSDGVDGQDGIDGRDGLSGIGFDYVRGMDGAVVVNRALVVPARFVLPENILAFAPAEDPYDPDGLTLTFGTQELAFRVYLGMMMRGEYCVIERECPGGWESLGELIFPEDGFVAIVPESTLGLFDTAFVATLLENGVLVEFGPVETTVDDVVVLEDVGKVLDYSRSKLQIGRNIRINFNRD